MQSEMPFDVKYKATGIISRVCLLFNIWPSKYFLATPLVVGRASAQLRKNQSGQFLMDICSLSVCSLRHSLAWWSPMEKYKCQSGMKWIFEAFCKMGIGERCVMYFAATHVCPCLLTITPDREIPLITAKH